MEPVLTMVIGLDGSGREDVQAEGTRIRTAEEAVRLVKGGDSAVLDAPNLRARTRRGILDPKALDLAARAELIRQNPAYGQIICRCESVTEGEIIDAIRRTPGARSLDGVKRRTRAGMGRCQAGFCSPRVMEILARELGVPQSEITKSGGASKIIVGTNKDSL